MAVETMGYIEAWLQSARGTAAEMPEQSVACLFFASASLQLPSSSAIPHNTAYVPSPQMQVQVSVSHACKVAEF